MSLSALIKKVFHISFIKFLFVAGINTLFGLSLYYLIVFLLKNIYLSNIIANIIAVLFNFKTYGALVFKSKDNSKLFRFVGVYVVKIIFDNLCIKGLSLIGVSNAYLVGAIIILPGALLSFILLRKFVFNDPATENTNQ